MESRPPVAAGCFRLRTFSERTTYRPAGTTARSRDRFVCRLLFRHITSRPTDARSGIFLSDEFRPPSRCRSASCRRSGRRSEGLRDDRVVRWEMPARTVDAKAARGGIFLSDAFRTSAALSELSLPPLRPTERRPARPLVSGRPEKPARPLARRVILHGDRFRTLAALSELCLPPFRPTVRRFRGTDSTWPRRKRRQTPGLPSGE